MNPKEVAELASAAAVKEQTLIAKRIYNVEVLKARLAELEADEKTVKAEKPAKKVEKGGK